MASEHEKLLLDIEKVRLETQKLEKDLASYEQRLEMDKKRITLDKSRFMWETIRLLGVAVITGLISYYTTSIIKKNEISESRKNIHYQNFYADKKKIKPDLTDLEQCNAACQIKEDYISLELPDIKKEMRKLDSMCKRKESLLAAQALMNKFDNRVSNSKAPDNNESKKIDELENKIKNLEQSNARPASREKAEIKVLQDSVSRLIQTAGIADLSKKSEELTTDYIKQSAAIKTFSLEISQSTSENKMAQGYPWTSWVKEGYYLVFDHMKIYIQDLQPSDESLIVEVCRSTTSAPCISGDLIRSDETLAKDRPLRFTEKGFEYVIRLDRIGKAGKNPFTKAAYLTFEKYSK